MKVEQGWAGGVAEQRGVQPQPQALKAGLSLWAQHRGCPHQDSLALTCPSAKGTEIHAVLELALGSSSSVGTGTAHSRQPGHGAQLRRAKGQLLRDTGDTDLTQPCSASTGVQSQLPAVWQRGECGGKPPTALDRLQSRWQNTAPGFLVHTISRPTHSHV